MKININKHFVLPVGPSPYIGIAFRKILGSTSCNQVKNVGLFWETENKESITSNISNHSKMLSTKNWRKRGLKRKVSGFFFFNNDKRRKNIHLWPVFKRQKKIEWYSFLRVAGKPKELACLCYSHWC